MKKIYKKLGMFGLVCSMIFNLLPLKVYANMNSDKTIYYLENETFDEMIASGFWEVEHIEKKDATAPEVVDGKIMMKTKESLCFQWMDLIGEDNYSLDHSYIFDFDLSITDSGNGFYWDYDASTRALYVAFGGYYNQIEINNLSEKVRTGETYLDYDALSYENKKIHGQVILEGTTVTSTLTDEYGHVIATGSRTNDAFADMDAREKCMTYLVLRCEDGAVEIDDFKFSMKSTKTISTTPFVHKEGRKVEYTACLNYEVKEKTVMKLGNTNLFSLENDVMAICGNIVTGTYGVGTYNVEVEVNPIQQILMVEITLPDGGTVRRGVGSIPDGEAFSWKSSSRGENPVTNWVSNESIHYKLVELNEYELNTKEPQGDEFSQNVYNIVQSFEDAHKTRLFAWTVKTSFFQNGDKMFLRYREKEEENWNLVEAKKQEEPSEVVEEDYYKVDLDNLVIGKEYEYQIGVQRVNQEDVWSNIYTFKTADEDLSEFKFIAIGDTQGVSWEGNTPATKGYMYTKAALDQAFKEVDIASFILHTGDVTEWGSTLSMWNHYFKAVGEYTKKIPHFATVGNHDTWGNDNNNYFSLHFNHPDNGAEALEQSYEDKITYPNLKVQFTESEDTIYSYNYGDAHFIVLHSGSYVAEDEYMLEAQRQWLIRDLEDNKDAKWKIVLVHEPVYHRKGGGEDRPWLSDVIEDYGVDLVIQGHSHLVTRTYPIKDGSIVTKTSVDLIKKKEGTVYTTIGSTTLNHDSLGNPNMEKCMLIVSPENTQASYTIVSVEEDSLTMTVKQLNGYVLDQFKIVYDDKEEHILDGFKYTIENDEVIITGTKEKLVGEIIIPETIEGTPVTKIGADAFSNNPGLLSIKLPSTVKSVGENALKNNENLTEITFYNPNCNIHSMFDLTNPNVVIYGYKGSTAEALANEKILQFVNIGQVEIETIELNYSTINLNIENTVELIATIQPADTTSDKTLTWSSNNETVATVDAFGKVTAKSEGIAIITVESVNGKKAVCEVTVPHEHRYTTKFTAPTCIEQGYTTYTCGCGHSYKDNYVNAKGHHHVLEESTVVEATCTQDGYTGDQKCSCGNVIQGIKVNKLEHIKVVDLAVSATCTKTGLTEGEHCSRCNSVLIKQEITKALGHSFTNYISNNDATYEKDGTKTAKCDRCDESNTITDEGSQLEHLVKGVTRISGKNRYATAFKSADALKATLGVDKFNAVIVANGTDFADALAGSYLAAKKEAPILMTDQKDENIKNLQEYIQANVKAGGTIYILGGTAAVSNSIDKELTGYNVKRLAGKDRYATNLLILEEAELTNEAILVATGTGFADSLSASATGLPILLVGKNLNTDQKVFLETHKENDMYIIGGTAAVSTEVEKQVNAYRKTIRLAGTERYDTSVLVAKTFFEKPTSAVVVYGKNFPDGLSGGILAYTIKGPLLLVENKSVKTIDAYTESAGITSGYVLGGSGLVSDDSCKTIFDTIAIK